MADQPITPEREYISMLRVAAQFRVAHQPKGIHKDWLAAKLSDEEIESKAVFELPRHLAFGTKGKSKGKIRSESALRALFKGACEALELADVYDVVQVGDEKFLIVNWNDADAEAALAKAALT